MRLLLGEIVARRHHRKGWELFVGIFLGYLQIRHRFPDSCLDYLETSVKVGLIPRPFCQLGEVYWRYTWSHRFCSYDYDVEEICNAQPAVKK